MVGTSISCPTDARWSDWAASLLSPLLYSLYTYDCMVTNSSNIIVKFVDDTTVVVLFTIGDETAYREEVSALTYWCQENHLPI